MRIVKAGNNKAEKSISHFRRPQNKRSLFHATYPHRDANLRMSKNGFDFRTNIEMVEMVVFPLNQLTYFFLKTIP